MGRVAVVSRRNKVRFLVKFTLIQWNKLVIVWAEYFMGIEHFLKPLWTIPTWPVLPRSCYINAYFCLLVHENCFPIWYVSKAHQIQWNAVIWSASFSILLLVNYSSTGIRKSIKLPRFISQTSIEYLKIWTSTIHFNPWIHDYKKCWHSTITLSNEAGSVIYFLEI